jgi:class 3 adenylate cyclase/predicted ATPase
MDPGAWLRSLGLEQYEPAFRAHAIDDILLPRLTADDLKDLGVNIVGHRRRMLDAISALRTEAAKSPPPYADSRLDRASTTAERRHVTVMFSDLVDSTALSTRMDPEDLREVISAYQRCSAETVRCFDGFVARYVGDAALVYFGYPHAHEDDAERAVRAALELVDAVGRVQTQPPLHIRVGIATGLVVVGDLIASGEATERGMVGETPNVAARLQGLAEPGMIVVADDTRKLLGNLFEFQDLGPKELKGVAKPVRVWAALRATSVESRFDALHASDLSDLVGRDEELELLLRRWDKAKAGEGQVVLLSGEAGIGKSRLTAALLERIAAETPLTLRHFCSPQHTDSALYPIIAQIKRAAGLKQEDPPAVRLGKLEQMLSQTSTPMYDAALIAEMLSLSNDGRYPSLNFTPQQKRQKTLDALLLQVEMLTRQRSVLLIFEDAHWMDPTTLDLLAVIVERISTLSALIIVTFRPDFDAQWTERPYVTLLNIKRLTQLDVEAIIDGLVGSNSLPATVRRDIIERTDGIPLFIEEMTRAVLEAGPLAERLVAAASRPGFAIPASLHAPLLARLDRLGPAKELAQIGAAIGREFSYPLLLAVMEKSESELRSALDRLVRARLVFQRGSPPDATYFFKHALIQDAAYGTLLRKQCRELHARVATVLSSQFADIVENHPELLARHYTEADLIEKASALWSKAGRRSMQRSALVEAATQFSRALGQLALLPRSTAVRREEIELQVAIITPLLHVKGYAAPETIAAAERARLLIAEAEALGEAPEDPLILLSLLYGFWAGRFVAFNGDEMRGFAKQFFALAEKQAGTVPLIAAHRIMGGSLLFTGEFVEGRRHFDRAIALYDPTQHRSLAERFGQDVRVTSLSFRSWAQWLLGYPTVALVDAQQAVGDAREIAQVATLMFALAASSFTYILLGRHGQATAQLEELVGLASQKNLTGWKGLGTAFAGCAFAATGKASDALRMIGSGFAAWRSTGATVFSPLFLLHLAESHAALDQLDDACRSIGEALTEIQTSKEAWFEAEVYRVAGEIALKQRTPNFIKAEAYFSHALTLSRAQNAKSCELRTAMSTARLWRDQGKSVQARNLLAPIYAWFTEGFDSPDLMQAKTLLDAL